MTFTKSLWVPVLVRWMRRRGRAALSATGRLQTRASIFAARRALYCTRKSETRALLRDRSLHRISRYWLGESPWIAPFTPSFAAAAARNCSACA